MDWLEPLPPDRRAPVEAFVSEVVGECPYCGKEMRRCDSRGIDADERLGCLPCVTAVEARCAICGKDVSRKHKRVEGSRGLVHQACQDKLRR
jgi:endogenous inhibitor of DNA gyrase (YacG/DUF329 family)